MVTTENPQAAPNSAARSLYELDAETLSHAANASGVAPDLRHALNSLITLAAKSASPDVAEGYEVGPFQDVVLQGAADAENNVLALSLARALVETLQADLKTAAHDQETYLRDELKRFEQMQLE